MRTLSLALLCSSSLAIPVTQMHAHTIHQYPDQMQLSQVHFSQPHPNGTLTLTARQGRIDAHGKAILQDHVTLKQGEDCLHTTTLTIQGNDPMLDSPSPIHGVYHGQRINAPQVTMSLTTGILQFPKGMTLAHPLPTSTQMRIQH